MEMILMVVDFTRHIPPEFSVICIQRVDLYFVAEWLAHPVFRKRRGGLFLQFCRYSGQVYA